MQSAKPYNIGTEFWRACSKVLAYTQARKMVLPFQERLSSSTKCSASEAHTWNSSRGSNTCLTSQISSISPGDQHGDTCHSQTTFTCVVVIWKGRDLSLKESKIPHDLYFISKLITYSRIFKNIQEPRDWSIDSFFHISFGSSNSWVCFHIIFSELFSKLSYLCSGSGDTEAESGRDEPESSLSQHPSVCAFAFASLSSFQNKVWLTIIFMSWLSSLLH